MIYRVLDVGVYDCHYTLRAWVDASSPAEAAERVQTVASWLYGRPVDDVCLGNVDSVLELEGYWGEPLEGGDRRWIQFGASGTRPLYDHDDAFVLYLVAPAQLQRLKAAYAAAAMHEQELAASDPEYAEQVVRDADWRAKLNAELRDGVRLR